MQSGIYHHFNKWLYLFVTLAGALTVFAFSPFDLYPIAWLTPAILFYALSKADTKKQYFTLGFLFGVGLFGSGTSWIFVMFHFAKAPLILGIVGTSLFVIVIALLTTGLFGLLVSLFRYHSLFARLLLFYPVGWVLIEWFRGWFLTGFPWLYLGNTQIDNIFASYAPVLGVLGVSYVSVLISGALISFIFGASVLRTVQIAPDPTSKLVSTNMKVEERFSSSIRILSALIIVLLTTVAIALENIQWTTPIGKAFKASVLQSNISQDEKLNSDNFQTSLKLYQEMTKQSRSSQLIVWPETSLFDAFENHLETVIKPLQRSLRNTNKTIMVGGFHINDANGVENSVLALSAKSREVYSKKHLVPFGEYTPLLEYIRWLDKWIQLPHSNLVSGTSSSTLEVAGHTAQMSICYEDAFGSEIIESLPKANLLINVTHDGWFTGSLEPEQHMQIARMRSLETGRYMVRATTTGPSGIINEKGKLLATAPSYTKKIITHKVQPFTGSTPFVRWGNWLIISYLSIVLLIGFVLRKR